MLKVKVGEFVNVMGFVRGLNTPNKLGIKKVDSLNFIAKDKVLSLAGYSKKLENVNSEKARLAGLFGKEMYTLKEGVAVDLHHGKLYEFPSQEVFDKFHKAREDRTNKLSANPNLKITELNLPSKAKMVVNFSDAKKVIVRIADTFYLIQEVEKYNKYIKDLLEKELELAEAKIFTRDDLAPLNDMSTDDMRMLGGFYATNKIDESENELFTVIVDPDDLKKPNRKKATK